MTKSSIFIVLFLLCRWLDISFNRLREINNLHKLTNLKKLFLCANRLTKIENLGMLSNLTMLELGDNRIRVRMHSNVKDNQVIDYLIDPLPGD